MLLIFREETKPQSWTGMDVDKNFMLLTYIFVTSTCPSSGLLWLTNFPSFRSMSVVLLNASLQPMTGTGVNQTIPNSSWSIYIVTGKSTDIEGEAEEKVLKQSPPS